MARRYHLNPSTGEPGACRAKKSCPFGDLTNDHYSSKEEAREAFESQNNPFAQPIVRKDDVYDWPEAKISEHRLVKPIRTVDATIMMSISESHRQASKDRSLEAWLTLPNGETVSFVSLIYRNEEYDPSVGSHLAMCDIETRVGFRGQGYARELRESIEAEIGLLIYSSGSYTPEGWRAFGAHGRFLPNPYATKFDQPGENFSSMGFVASWKHKVPRNMNQKMDYTDEQRDNAWRLSNEEVFRRMQDGEILWIED